MPASRICWPSMTSVAVSTTCGVPLTVCASCGPGGRDGSVAGGGCVDCVPGEPAGATLGWPGAGGGGAAGGAAGRDGSAPACAGTGGLPVSCAAAGAACGGAAGGSAAGAAGGVAPLPAGSVGAAADACVDEAVDGAPDGAPAGVPPVGLTGAAAVEAEADGADADGAEVDATAGGGAGGGSPASRRSAVASCWPTSVVPPDGISDAIRPIAPASLTCGSPIICASAVAAGVAASGLRGSSATAE